jgi:hypothetical protein
MPEVKNKSSRNVLLARGKVSIALSRNKRDWRLRCLRYWPLHRFEMAFRLWQLRAEQLEITMNNITIAALRCPAVLRCPGVLRWPAIWILQRAAASSWRRAVRLPGVVDHKHLVQLEPRHPRVLSRPED